jgi:hypothetical protein
MSGACSTHDEKWNAYRILVGKPEGERPLERPRGRWTDSIKIVLGETEWGCRDWIDLDHDRDQWKALVNTALNLQVPWNVGKCLSGCATGGFATSAQLRGVS